MITLVLLSCMSWYFFLVFTFYLHNCFCICWLHVIALNHSDLMFQVVVPKTYHKYTSRKVLTTQWIDGEKLSQSTESDVGELVSVGVICYLKQVIIFSYVWNFCIKNSTSLNSICLL